MFINNKFILFVILYYSCCLCKSSWKVSGIECNYVLICYKRVLYYFYSIKLEYKKRRE